MNISLEAFRQRVAYDLVGVATMDRFEGLPPREHPLSLFPDGKSVIVLGQRIRRGEFRSMEEGSLWQTPYRWLHACDDAIRTIESEGYECVPYAPEDAPRLPKRPVREGQCAPNGIRLSVEFAAVAAGLGEFGYHGLFMSPQFGIRQRLGLMVTDMEIEPSPPLAGPICDGCLECARRCPLDAISPRAAVTLACGARRMRIGGINPLACQSCPNGVSGDSKFFAGAEELHFEIENNQIQGDAKSRFVPGGLPNRLSAACGRACIARFEATHQTGYQLGFRIRQPWGFRPDTERGW